MGLVNGEGTVRGYKIESNADLRGANLRGANLEGAVLTFADLTSADLTGANLKGAKLGGAIFRLANLTGAELEGAKLTGASFLFAQVDLEQVPLIEKSFQGTIETLRVNSGDSWSTYDYALELRDKGGRASNPSGRKTDYALGRATWVALGLDDLDKKPKQSYQIEVRDGNKVLQVVKYKTRKEAEARFAKALELAQTIENPRFDGFSCHLCINGQDVDHFTYPVKHRVIAKRKPRGPR